MGVDKTLVDFADFAFRAGDTAREGLPWNYPYDAMRKTMLNTKDKTLEAAHTLTPFLDYVRLNAAPQVQQGEGKCARYVD